MIRRKKILAEEIHPEEVTTDILKLKKNHPIRFHEIVDDWSEKLPELDQIVTQKKTPEITSWVQATVTSGRTGYETVKTLHADIKRAASGIKEGKMITIKAIREQQRKGEDITEGKERKDAAFWYVNIKTKDSEVAFRQMEGEILPGVTGNQWVRFHMYDGRGTDITASVSRAQLEAWLKDNDASERRKPDNDEIDKKFGHRMSAWAEVNAYGKSPREAVKTGEK